MHPEKKSSTVNDERDYLVLNRLVSSFGFSFTTFCISDIFPSNGLYYSYKEASESFHFGEKRKEIQGESRQVMEEECGSRSPSRRQGEAACWGLQLWGRQPIPLSPATR